MKLPSMCCAVKNMEQINYFSSKHCKMFRNPDKDSFQCGKCKIVFQQFSHFIDHKRSQCNVVEYQTVQNENYKSELENSILPMENTFLISFNSTCGNLDSVSEEDNKDENLIQLVNNDAQIENEVVSYLLNPNEFLEENEIVPATGPFIIASKMSETGPVLLTNAEANHSLENVTLTNNTGPESKLIVTYPLQMDLTDRAMILSEETNNEKEVNHIILEKPEGKVLENYLISSDNLYKMNHSVEEDQTHNLLMLLCEQQSSEKTDNLTTKFDKKNLQKSKAKLSCSYCEKSFKKPFNLQQHERVHTGERPFQCIICGRAFSQKSNVRKHMMRHKVWPQAKQTLKISANQSQQPISQEFLDQMNYSCQYCSLSFKSYSLYKKHLSLHSNFKVYRCIQKGCDKTFNDLDEFLSHSKIHSFAEFQCHICLKSFTSLEDLGSHQYDHDLNERDKKEIEIKLKCEVCHAQFKTVESLKNHLAVDTHNYKCNHCKSVFSSERFLRRHLATHMDLSQSKYKCSNCKKPFRTQKYLQNHMFVHMNEKPFNCEHCDKQFASKYRLKRHLAIHLNQYFECPFKVYLGCQKTFYRKDKLRDHMMTHSNCRIRSCHYCSKTFSSLAKLNQHAKKEHKSSGRGRPAVLKCKNCLQTFRKQKQLMQHHCTVGEKKFRSSLRTRNLERKKSSETVSNIEIFMVPYVSDLNLVK